MNGHTSAPAGAWLAGAALVTAAALILTGRSAIVRFEQVAGTAITDSAAAAELSFPIRHATVDADDAGHWWVSLDDGTTSPDRYQVPASPGGYPHVVHPVDGCNCAPIMVTVQRDLTVVVTGTWMGRACTFTAGSAEPSYLRCI